jgi:hypothetical protein
VLLSVLHHKVRLNILQPTFSVYHPEHSLHLKICRTKPFHTPTQTCVYVLCDTNCARYHKLDYERTVFKIAVFWDVAPYSLVDTSPCFRGAYCLHHQGDGATSQNTAILILVTIRISNLTSAFDCLLARILNHAHCPHYTFIISHFVLIWLTHYTQNLI